MTELRGTEMHCQNSVCRRLFYLAPWQIKRGSRFCSMACANIARRGKIWTDEEKKILTSKYPLLGKVVCELLPNKTYEQIKRYAQKNGVSIRKHWTWTRSEEETIRNQGPIIGNKICHLIPAKTPVAIKSKMARMGIKVIYQPPSPLVLSEIDAIRLAAFIDGVGIEKQTTTGRVDYSC
jgi:hypothetical protein